MKRRILVVGEDLEICSKMRACMENSSSDVCCMTSLTEALECFVKQEYCVAIMDLHLPDIDSLNILRAMRSAKRAPILVLTDPLESEGKIAFFHAGANVCMEKPVDIKVCAAQATALILLYLDSEYEAKEYFPLTFGTEVIINPLYRQVIIDGNPIELTRTEFDLLFCLARYPGQVWSRGQLYHQVWTDDLGSTGDNIVRTHIGNLRKKLADAGKNYVQTSRGIGYKFVPPVARQ